MNTVFICATHFQILSCLSICTGEKLRNSTLILSNNLHKDSRWVRFLIDSKLFESILVFPNKLPYYKRIHFLTKKRDLIQPTIKERIKGLFFPEEIISNWIKDFNILHGKQHISPSKIEKIFISSPTGSFWKFGSFIQKQNTKCKIIGFDEGLGSYLPSSFNNKNIAAAYLFQPELSYLQTPKHKILPLDRSEMTYLWKLASDLFNIKALPKGHFFFDQWIGMPWTNKKINTENWEKTHFIKTKLSILRNIDKTLTERGENLYYVPHPLQDVTATNYFKMQGLRILDTCAQLPFELILLCTKSKTQDKLLISIFSGAPIMPLLALKSKQKYKAIMLYELFKEEPELHTFFQSGELKALLNSIALDFSNQTAIPKNIVELKNLLLPS